MGDGRTPPSTRKAKSPYVQIPRDLARRTTAYGFEEAATKVAMGVRFNNPTRQPRQVKFRVEFDLKDEHGGAGPNLGGPRPAGRLLERRSRAHREPPRPPALRGAAAHEPFAPLRL